MKAPKAATQTVEAVSNPIPKEKIPPIPTPTTDPEAKALMKSSQGLTKVVATLTIRDNKDLDTAVGLLGQISTLQDSIEARRLFFVKPLKDHVKAIDAEFKRIREPIEAADEELRRKVRVFREAEAARVYEEQRKRDEAARLKAEEAERIRLKAEKARNKKLKAELAEQAKLAEEEAMEVATTAIAPAPAKTMSAGNTKVGTSKVWKFEVVDENLVPREYLTVDNAAVRRAVSSGLRTIPGVRIYAEEQLRVSGFKDPDYGF